MMQAVKRAVRRIVPRPVQTPACPVAAEKSAYSAMFSLFDEEGRPSQRLIELGIDATEKAMQLDDGDFGEEYRLIGGLMLAMKPNRVAVVGRGTEKAIAVINRYLPEGGLILDTPSGAELVLISGTGDGDFEEGALQSLRGKVARGAIVMMNDTRLWGMLRFCREITEPKLDMTSFGKWSGTMLVEL